MTEDLLAAYDEHLRGVGVPARGAWIERDGPLLRVVGEQRGFVTGPRDLSGHDVDALIAAQVAFFGARGEAVEWKTRGHDLPGDLPDRLRAAGFVAEPTETVVIGRVTDLPAAAPVSDDVVIRRVGGEAIPAIVAMESQVWGRDCGFIGEHLAGRLAAAPDRLAIFTAETGGQVVAAAWVALREDGVFASLWGGSTLEAWRGRGIYRTLVAVRARVAAEHGYRYLQVDASDDSRPILERLGFSPVTTTTPYVWSPPA
ncbi:GNAT family N-acetyltransferase [Actinoallomurus rhizosphaericola]|uniref:GNAT family N-acetyltransferase n=1 Tax=Actinoallomurus rhizosphaericola TaxID=2952536 RepID=UPI0020927A9F|nr:GNAT family N-acetyltransferase [Actinoallomurus rhizosphaericola]MCO5998745.1 GNAT family N-acetyltransferase [Actinoallomurus rhizosphaericola]